MLRWQRVLYTVEEDKKDIDNLRIVIDHPGALLVVLS